MKTSRMLVMVGGLAAALGLGGCATTSTSDLNSAGRQALRNEQGYVIGYKDLLRNKKTGEVSAQVTMFTPIRNDADEVIGYEEETRNGAVIRDLQGRQIGNRFSDLRSRNTNMRSRGVTIVIGSLDTRRAITNGDQPKIYDLMASLNAADLSALR